ncbi:transcriptional regulator [Aureibaculum sp. A20]|uniref:Transcriptional regulator n=1 Tax=Aureibaculum flavum TaxID=2795986 RepID=A0ABS0WRW6_9FLAO|nr:LuxR C-terminal-related transcriptional regulator [Aureibaculum flavum]MBJ2174679.1 transcriptional regulator [Aureibaculum flavum]
MRKSIYIFFILVNFFCSVLNAQFSPYFKNYSIADYNAGNQNWGLSKTDNSQLYVANNSGLLTFDGIKWTLSEMPNKTVMRSVLHKEGRIYVGSYEEFGYWQKNEQGVLEYHSLSDLIKGQPFQDEEFWQITEWNDAIIFRSFFNIYIYKDDKIEIIHPPSTTISCHVVDNQFYVATLRHGIFSLKNNKLIPFITEEVLKEKKVSFITNYQNNRLLIGTALHGCFIYENNKLFPWQAPINKELKKYQLNNFSKNNNNLMFGTIQNGLYITNKKGEIEFQVNKENGLLNNTILGQKLTNDGKLWLGLNSGIAQIDMSSNLVFYNDSSGKLGAVYDIINFKNTTYIGSNTGLYYLDKENKLEFIAHSQGQVWDLKEINGQLFCGHNNGTYLVEHKKLKLVSSHAGGWVIKKVPERQNIYVQGTYVGLVSYKKEGSTWQVKHLGATTNPFRFLVFENKSTAWAAHAYKGLYRIKFDVNYDSIVSIRNYSTKGLNSEYNVRVYKIKNDICFKTNEGWQKYEALRDSIVDAPILNNEFGKHAYVISEENENILSLKQELSIEFKSFNTINYQMIVTDEYLKNRLVIGYENISNFNGNQLALSLNDGFLITDTSKKILNKKPLKPFIDNFKLNGKNLTLDHINKEDFKYKSNVSIGLTVDATANHFFEYTFDTISPTKWIAIENEKIELNNLTEGDYNLYFRSNNSFKNPSEAINLNFNVSPPWYRAKTGYVLYMLLGLLIMAIFYFLHKGKIAKEQRLLQLDLEKKQAIILKEAEIENEKRLISIRNEGLKSEVKLKSKQLANNAMSLVKKNETLTNLKREFVLNRNSFDTELYQKLLKKIDGSLGQKDEWKIFEYNFNQVHEDFFIGLKKQFPKLTHKDLKLCAYIKMNMLTKEIAPLMNISERGVETHRYRLKKKLNLDKEDLQTFLKIY